MKEGKGKAFANKDGRRCTGGSGDDSRRDVDGALERLALRLTAINEATSRERDTKTGERGGPGDPKKRYDDGSAEYRVALALSVSKGK